MQDSIRRLRDWLAGREPEPRTWNEAIRRRFRDHDQERRRWAVDLNEIERESVSHQLVLLVDRIVQEVARPHYTNRPQSEWPIMHPVTRRFTDQVLGYFMIAAFLPMLEEERTPFDRAVAKAFYIVEWTDVLSSDIVASMESASKKVDSVTRVMAEMIEAAERGSEATRAMYRAMIDGIWNLTRAYVWSGKRETLDALSKVYPIYAVNGLGRWVVIRHQRGEPIDGLPGAS